MTKFQNSCITQVKDLLSSIKDMPKYDFKEMHVQNPDFIREVMNLLRRILGLVEIPYKMKELAERSFSAQFKYKDHSFQIYIYEDSAEIHRDDSAFVCEPSDYDSESELIKDFLKQLSDAVCKEVFNGNAGGASIRDLIFIALFLLLVLTMVMGGWTWLLRQFRTYI